MRFANSLGRRGVVVLAAWTALVAVAGVAAAATYDDGTQRTSANGGTSSAGGRGATTTVPGTVAGGPGAKRTVTTKPASGGSTTTTAAAGGAGGVSTTTAPAGAGGGDATTAERPFPLPGTYHQTVTGTATFNGKPQDVPKDASFTIEQLTATDWRQSASGGGATTTYDLRTLANEIQLVKLVLSGGINKTFDPATPVRYSPLPPATGTSWNWRITSTDNKTTIDQTGTIEGTEAVVVAGTTVNCVRVRAKITLSGDLTGTQDVTVWVRPSDKLGVKTHAVVNVRYGVFTIASDTTSELVSLSPA